MIWWRVSCGPHHMYYDLVEGLVLSHHMYYDLVEGLMLSSPHVL